MNIDNLTIGEAKHLAAMFGGGNAAPKPRDWGHAIVVLDRGFVYVGHALSDGEFLHIKCARNIRVWGTTAGLAQLVTTGPTPNTKLDAMHDVIAPMRALISIHPTEAKLWAK